jgi:Tfp pilus assembly protein PilP
MGFGFFGEAMTALRKPMIPTAAEIDQIKNAIKDTKDWYAQIREKSEQRKISIDSMLSLDANWYFQKKGPLKKEISIEDVKESIRVNEGWMKEIAKKAEERKISVDSAMTEDAIWFMKNQLHVSDIKHKEVLTLEKVIDKIKHNYEWMEQIREKAKKRNIPVDTMINMDARWYLEQNK